jgi:formyltetrahydrofolate synthetase
MAQICAKWSWR